MQRSKKAVKQSLAELIKKKSMLSITVSDIVENAVTAEEHFIPTIIAKKIF